jgi:Signal peptidase subunit
MVSVPQLWRSLEFDTLQLVIILTLENYTSWKIKFGDRPTYLVSADVAVFASVHHMYSSLQRLNGFFSFLTTVLFALAACIALTSYIMNSDPTTNLRVSNFRV